MKPTSLKDLQEFVIGEKSIFMRGGGSKPGLSTAENGSELLAMDGLQGMLAYEPGEYTFTAYAGTPLQEIRQALAENQQYLPFDPPLVEAGGTLGGTVAAGLSGSGRYRFGGVRDFILGVAFIDGQGKLIRGGGKVVKNAAGFDLPKLMVGSLGKLGALVELSFKVFPHPEAYLTLAARYGSSANALEALIRLSRESVDLFALDLHPQASGADLLIRIGGMAGSFPRRVSRLKNLLGSEHPPDEIQLLEGEPEAAFWHQSQEFSWLPEDAMLVKVPLTPKRVLGLDKNLVENMALRRYTVGANLAWVAWPGSRDSLEQILNELSLSGLVVVGPPGKPILGRQNGDGFARRVKTALDPMNRWR